MSVRTLVAVLAAAVAGSSVGSPLAGVASGDCGFRSRPPATFAHVIWIWMENHS
jgi:hypothetical protein